MNSISIPYVNNLSIEADIPVELARSLFDAGIVIIGNCMLAGKDSGISIDSNLSAYGEIFFSLAPLLGISEKRMDGIMERASMAVMSMIINEVAKAKSKEAK